MTTEQTINERLLALKGKIKWPETDDGMSLLYGLGTGEWNLHKQGSWFWIPDEFAHAMLRDAMEEALLEEYELKIADIGTVYEVEIRDVAGFERFCAPARTEALLNAIEGSRDNA